MSFLTELWHREKVYERVEINLGNGEVGFSRFEWSCNSFRAHDLFADIRDYAEFARFVPLWFTNMLYKYSTVFNDDFAVGAMDRIERALISPESALSQAPPGLFLSHGAASPRLLVEVFLGNGTQRIAVKGVPAVMEAGDYEVLALIHFIDATYRRYPEGMHFLINEFAFLRSVAKKFGMRELIDLKRGSARAVQSAEFAFKNTAMN